MPLTIRRAAPDDLDALVPLFDAYRAFYGQPSDPGRARGFLRERLQRGESVALLAERGGAAIGFVQLYPTFSSVRAGRLWILNDLYVAAEARRGGVARALLDAAAGFARGEGAVGIALETARDNAAARALYRAAGWEESETQWYALSFAPAAAEPAEAGEALFSYGALQDEAVQRRLFGRALHGSADALTGYRLDWLGERDPAAVETRGVVRHPVARASGDPADRVPGTLFRVGAVELARADEYEAGDYRRVRVRLASGAEAWLYVGARAG
ncbi:GNAT family N-acetyltransferase [Vulcaniibacterium tengchongense]|uniref:Ribosomal protein S18 acetylase RimI-like enzyme n=1 Tax=Vulcaniibacterium tengchongense TaxID=1273429 RepID=A0A3N4VEE4_9GAMM|nr:ribosomal protein S18 acetylase RimI-like enzyme [Vulcaniibacterium tengchongense]